MIVYESRKSDFRLDVKNNQIEKKILKSFERRLGHSTSRNEIQSWKNSMMYMSNVLDDSSIPDDAGVCIEYMLPRSSKRIDFIVTGKDKDNLNSMIIIELKQWESVTKTSRPGVVSTFVGGGVRDQVHPSYQAWSYSTYLKDFSEPISTNNIQIRPCAYLHNCEQDEDVKSSIYNDVIEQAPLFSRNDSSRLTDFIKNHIRYGDKDGVMYLIENGKIKPSKKLAESFGNLIKGKQEFVMLDDQKLIFERALELAASSSKKNKKTLIVNGGPGTGKSVVAVNLLVESIKRRLNSQYVSKNAAPREVYSTKLTGVMTQSRYKSLFVGSGSFNSTEANAFDVLIVDEAHRLNEKSGLYGNLGENQVKEIINSSLLSIFFLDEDQRVALSDIGSKDEIYHWAKKLKSEVIEMELHSQFRCNGEAGYLAWLDNYLQVRETANTDMSDIDYELKVFDDPLEMHNAIKLKNKNGELSRTVAGYCWDWVSKKDPSAFDIEIDDLKMKWNLKEDGSKWIISPSSINEIGCIHTCQGLEVDYIGVIIGPDLVVRDGKVVTNGLERPSRDKTVKGLRTLHRKNPEEAKSLVDPIIKNTYRTLMTRGMKGCYLYCTDRETRDYFKKAISCESN